MCWWFENYYVCWFNKNECNGIILRNEYVYPYVMFLFLNTMPKFISSLCWMYILLSSGCLVAYILVVQTCRLRTLDRREYQRMAWCLSSFSCFCFYSLSGSVLIRVSENLFIFTLDCFVLRNPRVHLYWCIMRFMSYDFVRLYDSFPLRLYYDYDELWLFWINDEVTPWTFVIICWFIIKYSKWGLRVLDNAIKEIARAMIYTKN
jgi:hypothetical protein